MTKTNANTKTKAKTKTKWLKDPTCAIFLKMIWLKDINFDDGGWINGASLSWCTEAGVVMHWRWWCSTASDGPKMVIHWRLWCSDASHVVMHCGCWCADAADALMLLMHWCYWCADAADVLILADLSIAFCSSFSWPALGEISSDLYHDQYLAILILFIHFWVVVNGKHRHRRNVTRYCLFDYYNFHQ